MIKIDNPLLFNSILDFINPDDEFSEVIKEQVFNLADKFILNCFEYDFCQIIVNSIDKKHDLRKVAIFLDILTWSTPDNGTKLDFLTLGWLKSGDILKIKLLLYRYEWLPSKKDWNKINKNILKLDNNLKPILEYYSEEIIYSSKTGFRRIKLLRELIKTYDKLQK